MICSKSSAAKSFQPSLQTVEKYGQHEISKRAKHLLTNFHVEFRALYFSSITWCCLDRSLYRSTGLGFELTNINEFLTLKLNLPF